MPHLRNKLKRRVLETQKLTLQSDDPHFPVPSCMVFVFQMAPLNLAGAETPGSAASARRRSARNGMLHAGRRREPGTTDGVLGSASVAVGQSERPCDGICVLWGTAEWCDSGVSTAVVTVAKAACVVCARILGYGRERKDGASRSGDGYVRTGALRRPSCITVGGGRWRGYAGNT